MSTIKLRVRVPPEEYKAQNRVCTRIPEASPGRYGRNTDEDEQSEHDSDGIRPGFCLRPLMDSAGSLPLYAPVELGSESFHRLVCRDPSRRDRHHAIGDQRTGAKGILHKGLRDSVSFLAVQTCPGIFVDQNGAPVPFASGSSGQVLTLYITGAGHVFPEIATGAAPSDGTPATQLPVPVLPVSVSIGGQSAGVVFYGIPLGLAGVVQINFVVPSNLPPGPQPLLVTVNGQPSQAATFTVTQ